MQLQTSEPVRITNNEGRSTYIFKEKGSFPFEYLDEAGNSGTTTATVDFIDKDGPRVTIVRSYAYGELGSQTFGTIKDDNGNVLYSSGVTLEVQKQDNNAKEFEVLGATATDSKKVVTVRGNGVVSFTVKDEYGNLTVIKEEVNNIITTSPQVGNITYTFVDDAGETLPASQIVTIDGQPYAQGKVKVTVSGQTTSGNSVFSGVAPIKVNNAYTNQISGSDGAFTYSKIYAAEGSTFLALSDALGNVNKIPVTVKGLDNKAPEIKLNTSTVAIAQNKQGFDFRTDLGGYAVSDNVSKADQIAVEISGLDLTQLGRQRVTYTAKDQVGHATVVHQDVNVVASDGMLIMANDVLISAASEESALFDTNKLAFTVSRHNLMDVKGQELLNEQGTYDIIYQSGLYREGQMKIVAEKVTYKNLIDGHFNVTFPSVGWYTIIVRNQEREREYATFFIGRKE
ncbi:hypothetical protein D3C73_917900 [compost metagenome]